MAINTGINLQDYWNQQMQKQDMAVWNDRTCQYERAALAGQISGSAEAQRVPAPQKPASKLLLLEDL